MTFFDWSVVVLYIASAIWIGFYFSKRASQNSTEFFVAGRSLPWYVAGTSMVATTFSSDTPLLVAALSRDDGIAANWIWWAGLMGGLATVFFFAKLWRRSEVITEIEFIALRYGTSKPASMLRVFRAIFDGVFFNSVIMASVTLAMSKIIVVLLGLSSDILFELPVFGGVTPTLAILTVLGIGAVFYTVSSGLYGVVYTDLIQFSMAMVGSIALAIIVYNDAFSGPALMANLEKSGGFSMEKITFFPTDWGWDIVTFTFIILVMFSWLSTASGPGFFIQRTLATRSEKDAILSVYWFAFCHYVIRSWPWIFVGIASLIYFPNLIDTEQAYPLMINKFLPIGLKGIMVASLLAAFMSTLDTHINWGASYLINDVYRPFISKKRSEKHYLFVSRVCMIFMTFFALILATKLSGILAAYKYLIVMLSGISFVLIARWYWWCINVWSEASSLLCALVVGNMMYVVFPDRGGEDYFAVRLFGNLVVTTLVCILVTYCTSPLDPPKHVVEFYRKLRVPGPGWQKVRQSAGIKIEATDDLTESIVGWGASTILIYALLFGSGYMIFQDWAAALWCAGVALISGWVARNRLRSIIKKISF